MTESEFIYFFAMCVCGGTVVYIPDFFFSFFSFAFVSVTLCVHIITAFFYSMTTNVNIEGQAFTLLLSNDSDHAYIRA